MAEAEAKKDKTEEPVIQAEFGGTIQPKYKPQSLEQKIEQSIEQEARVIYRLGSRHKMLIAGLAIALVAAVTASVLLGTDLGAANQQNSQLSQAYSSAAYNASSSSALLRNLSGAVNNYTVLRGKISILQSAMENQNYTIKGLRYAITNLSDEVSGKDKVINSQNQTLFSLKLQLANLTKHVNFGYEQTIVQKNYSNLYLSPNGNSGSSYSRQFIARYSGILSMNVTLYQPYQVYVVGPYGTYFNQNFSSGTSIIGVPVIGSPNSTFRYTFLIVNKGTYYSYGSVGAYLFN